MFQHHLECLLSLLRQVTSSPRHKRKQKLRQQREPAREKEIEGEKKVDRERDKNKERKGRGGAHRERPWVGSEQGFLFPVWQCKLLT